MSIRLNPTVDPADAPRLSAQCVSLLERLQRGPITNVEAATSMRILNLTARISELRQAGHDVRAERVPGARGTWVYRLCAPVPVGQMALFGGAR